MAQANVLRLPFRFVFCVRLQATRFSGYYVTMSFALRALKHRSLSPDDPFGERSAFIDPADGFYGAWSGVNLDGFVNAASSEEVRTAHFGPEWSRFTTVGRVSFKIMKEQGALTNDTEQRHLKERGDNESAPPRLFTAEELHLRELNARRKSLEKNYATYEEYVEKELGVGEGNCDEEGFVDDHGHQETGNAVEDSMPPLPRFMAGGGGDATPPRTLSRGRHARDLGAPGPLTQRVFCALGEPHGDPKLPLCDPFYWGTEEVILWLTTMEGARRSLLFSAAAVGDGGVVRVEEALLMHDDSLREAFRIARANGEFLLHKTEPSVLFQVMRRWYLRRQEIVLTIMKMQQRNEDNNVSDNAFFMNSDFDAASCDAVECGKAKLNDVIMKVTPQLIQETICQCYPYCR